MKVIYDISTVGNRPETRTGVARVAWTTAMLLRQRLGDEVSFAATGSIDAALQIEDLFRQHRELRSACQPVGAFARFVYHQQQRLIRQQGKPHSHSGLLYRVQQQILTNCLRVLNIARTPIQTVDLRQVDLFHSPYARIPRQVRKALPGRHVLTVNDLTPLLLDERYFAPGQRAITRRMIESVQPGDWIITISESTRNDLCNYSSVNPERVITVQLAASEELFYPVYDIDVIDEIRKKYKIPPGRYLLTLHSLAPHKNLPHLIRSFQKLITQEKINDLTLVVCGGQGRPTDEILQSLNLGQSNLNQIYFTGYIADEDLAALYSGALAFVFPSLYEGFGLPVLEAMQCGCPVIASDTSSLPEIVGDAEAMVAPYDEDALCNAIIKFYHNKKATFEASHRNKKRASLFSWEKNIAETLNIYSQVLAECTL